MQRPDLIQRSVVVDVIGVRRRALPALCDQLRHLSGRRPRQTIAGALATTVGTVWRRRQTRHAAPGSWCVCERSAGTCISDSSRRPSLAINSRKCGTGNTAATSAARLRSGDEMMSQGTIWVNPWPILNVSRLSAHKPDITTPSTTHWRQLPQLHTSPWLPAVSQGCSLSPADTSRRAACHTSRGLWTLPAHAICLAIR